MKRKAFNTGGSTRIIALEGLPLLLFLAGAAWWLLFSSFTTSFVQAGWEAPVSADTIQNPYPEDPLRVKQGEELYNMYCWSCHGEEGYGDGAAGGAAGVQPANFHDKAVKEQSDGALFWKLSTGRGSMPPFKEVFSEEQRWQLIAYIRKLTNGELDH